MNYASEHNIYPVAPSIFHHETDTVSVKKPLTFNQISEMFKIPYESIALLNPSFRKGIIPAGNKVEYKLKLPKEYIAAFINNEESLYTYKAKTPNKYELLSKTNNRQSNTSKSGYHTVRSGESLSKIASKYNCSIVQLKVWNKLKTIRIHPGQKILVFNPREETTDNLRF
jgi:membrane-bound lytic murein transglycosylase D